jgi:hypothetical protein
MSKTSVTFAALPIVFAVFTLALGSTRLGAQDRFHPMAKAVDVPQTHIRQSTPVLALNHALTTADTTAAQRKAPPDGEYKKVSTLVALPDFLPGLGTLYVDPVTLPAGPFLAYDRQGNLVSSIYMIPLKDMNAQKAFARLKTGPGEQVDHVDVVYNAGHPGVAEPHYHLILWYVSPGEAAGLK